MRTFIGKIILKSQIKRNEQKHVKKFLTWDQIERIALIISADSILNKSEVDKWIADTKKFVEVFYVEPRSKEPSFGDWHCLSKKDVSLFKLPAKKIETVLGTKQFDVVINACSSHDLYSASLASSFTSSFQCAGVRGFHDADLIIQTPQPIHVSTLLKDTLHYLKMIRV